MEKNNLVSQAEFARLNGWHRSRVTQLKQEGRLVIDGETGLVMIEESLLKIESSEDPNRDDVKKRHASQRGQEEQNETSTFADARAKEQHYKALRAEAEYKEMIGELIRKSEVASAVSDMVSTFKQSVENLPHRIAPELVNKDIDFIRAKLRDEIYQMLKELQKNCEIKMEG